MATSTFEERLLPVLVEELASRPRDLAPQSRGLHRRSIAALAAVAVLIGTTALLTGGNSERTLNITVLSGAMLPTFSAGDIVAIEVGAYDSRTPRRGDVIAFRLPRYPEEEIFIKRVMGLPGDIVEAKAGVVSVNGEVLDEPYARRDDRSGRWTVEPGHLFVLGDDRTNSIDSRFDGAAGWPVGMGQIPIQNILGRVQGSVGGTPDIAPPPAHVVPGPAVP